VATDNLSAKVPQSQLTSSQRVAGAFRLLENLRSALNVIALKKRIGLG